MQLKSAWLMIVAIHLKATTVKLTYSSQLFIFSLRNDKMFLYLLRVVFFSPSSVQYNFDNTILTLLEIGGVTISAKHVRDRNIMVQIHIAFVQGMCTVCHIKRQRRHVQGH